MHPRPLKKERKLHAPQLKNHNKMKQLQIILITFQISTDLAAKEYRVAKARDNKNQTPGFF